MKIVHVITRLIVGGAQENTLLSCEGQHRLGHDVTLVTGPPAGPEGSLMDRANSAGYRVVVVDELIRAISPSVDLEAYRRLRDVYRSIGPDVIHTHSSKAGILGRWAARGLGAAVVHTIHGLAFTASTRRSINFAYRLLEKATAPITDKIVCVADAMRDQSLAAGVGRPGQYVTVYSGMETEPFLDPPIDRATVRRSLGFDDSHVVVGTIARLFDLKGHDDLIDLAPDLCRRFPLLRFLWVGDGSLRSRLERRIAEAGLSDRFVLAGLVPPSKVPELTNAMDILAHPSRREGLARALPQGALCEAPVVTYDIDGNREGLIEGTTGYAVKAFDVPAFGRRLAEFVDNPAHRQSFGSSGRAFARGRFDADVMVRSLESVYRSGARGGSRQ